MRKSRKSPPKRDLAERFWEKVAIAGPDECWLWLGATGKHGLYGVRYGHFRLNTNKLVRSHRCAWELANGETVPPGKKIRHSCDTPLCCNPAHLLPGTQKDNIKDRNDRGLSVNHQGEKHGMAKLTEAEVISIRAALAAGEPSRQIARKLGLSDWGVRYTRIGWKHVA